MKIVYIFSFLLFFAKAANAQEDSIKTKHDRFYHPETKTEAPAEVIVKEEVAKPTTEVILDKTVEKKKPAQKKTASRKDND